MKVLAALLLLFPVFAWAHPKRILLQNGPPIQVHVTEVKAVLRDPNIRVANDIPMFKVLAYSTNGPANEAQTDYVLFCLHAAPELGKAYSADDEYVDGQYSLLKLWPIERSTLGLHEKGLMYRVVQFHGMFNGPQSDMICDVRAADVPVAWTAPK